MTEFDAILEDIRTNPADDLPRLALADWLMEQDDPASRSRGEFIYARCRAASLAPRDPERGVLQRRAAELRERNEVAWLGGLAEHLDSWDFERGMTVAGLSERSLRRGAFARLVACPGWKWVIGLRCSTLSSHDLTSLFGRSQLGSITSIDARDGDFSLATARTLGASHCLERVASLDLGYTRLGEGLHFLLESQHLMALRILRVDNNGIGPDGVLQLVASDLFARLESLDLSRNAIGDRGAATLARSAQHPLRELRLSSCGIRKRGGIALATSAALANLTLLDLSDNPIGDAAQDELRERFGERVILT